MTVLNTAVNQRIDEFRLRVESAIKSEQMTIRQVEQYCEIERSTIRRFLTGKTDASLNTAMALSIGLGIEL